MGLRTQHTDSHLGCNHLAEARRRTLAPATEGPVRNSVGRDNYVSCMAELVQCETLDCWDDCSMGVAAEEYMGFESWLDQKMVEKTGFAVVGEDSRHTGFGPAIDYVDTDHIAPDKMGSKVAVSKMMGYNLDRTSHTVQSVAHMMIAASITLGCWIPTGLVADYHMAGLSSSVVDFERTRLSLHEVVAFAAGKDWFGYIGYYSGLRGHMPLEVRNQCKPHWLYGLKRCIHSSVGSGDTSGIAKTQTGLHPQKSHDDLQTRTRLLRKSHSSGDPRMPKTYKSRCRLVMIVRAAFHHHLENYQEVGQQYRHFHCSLTDCYRYAAGHQETNLQDFPDRTEAFDSAFHLLLRSLLGPRVGLALDSSRRPLVHIRPTDHVLILRKMLQALETGFALGAWAQELGLKVQAELVHPWEIVSINPFGVFSVSPLRMSSSSLDKIIFPRA